MDSNRILDRNNYSVKTMENFEIVSAYYIDIFYNHLYNEAKKLHVGGSVSSITEGYKHTLNAFLKSLTSPKLYKKSVVGIHRYYMSIGFGTISFSKCMDRIVQEFIPSDYFGSLSSTRKMSVLRMVLSQAIKTLIRKIVDEHMVKIIDFHKEKDNARILQDDFIDCLILEREGMFQRFIASSTKTNKNETVNRLIAEKMQVEIKRLVAEKYEQKKQILILKKAYIQKKELENRQNEMLGNLRQKIQQLESRVAQAAAVPVAAAAAMVATRPPPQQFQSNAMHSNAMQNNAAPQSNVAYSNAAPMSAMQNNAAPMTADHQKKDIGSNTNSPVNITRQSMFAPNEPKKAEVEKKSPQLSSMMNMSDSDDNDKSAEFVEVTTGNIDNILRGDSDYIQNLRDSDAFKMDEGTTLDDFA